MNIEFLLEEESAKVALENILPGIIGPEHSYQLHPFKGKKDLLIKLPDRLRAYGKYLSDDDKIVILIDKDNADCSTLKRQLEQIAREAGFTTKTSSPNGRNFQVLTRIAIEELEAWFFGDVPALVAAYPKVPPSLGTKTKYRDPDAIHNTWESLHAVLRRAGYNNLYYPKITVASEVSKNMDPDRNSSISFQVFVSGIRALINE